MLANETSNFFFFFLGVNLLRVFHGASRKQESDHRVTDAHPAASTLTSLYLSLPLLMVWFGKNHEPG